MKTGWKLVICSICLGLLCSLVGVVCVVRDEIRQMRGDYYTPLHGAVFDGDIRTVRALVASHPEYVNCVDYKTGTPLSLAAATGSTAIARILIEGGADLNLWCPLGMAAGSGRLEMMNLLLDQRADPDGTTSRWVPIVLASREGQLGAVELLVARGANVNTCSYYGMSALQWACSEGKKDVAEFLIQRGAEVNHRQDGGRTALHCAAVAGEEECVRILLASGAERNLRDDDGFTASGLARKFGYVKVAEEIDRGEAGYGPVSQPK